MSDLDLIGLLAASTAQGPSAQDDAAVCMVGQVLAVDAPGRRVRIRLHGGAVWLPGVASRYMVGAPAAVLVDPIAGRPVRVLAAVTPRSPVILGTVLAGPSGGNLTVMIEGTSYTLPCPIGTYTVGQSAWAVTDDWGVPVIILGPSSVGAPDPVAPPTPPPPAIETATATIGPQSTGTYRYLTYDRWDVWGGSLGGGLAGIYQGNAYGSGQLVGLACYGDQIVNLAALSIVKATLTVKRNGSGSGPVALTVQGSPHGTRPAGAPSSSGTTVSTPPIPLNESAAVDLPADVCEALRSGAAKGLAAVGGAYAGFGGTLTPGSFVLTIQYTRNA